MAHHDVVRLSNDASTDDDVGFQRHSRRAVHNDPAGLAESAHAAAETEASTGAEIAREQTIAVQREIAARAEIAAAQ